VAVSQLTTPLYPTFLSLESNRAHLTQPCAKFELIIEAYLSSTNQFIGVVGGSIGSDPFDPRTFSGSSYSVFTALQKRGGLRRAFGARNDKSVELLLKLKNFRLQRRWWSRQYYLDPAYRNALTAKLAACVQPDDLGGAFLQIGAMFSMPQAVNGKGLFVAYHDSNIVEALAAEDMRGIPSKRIDAAFAYELELARRCDLIFVTGSFLRASFINTFHVDPSRVITVGGGPNLIGGAEIDESKTYETQELLYVGVDFERKGGPLLLNALARVAKLFPKAKLHIVGPRQIDIPTDIRDRVVFHGYVCRQTPDGAALFRDLFHRCSVFVLPSMYEPFGMSSLEAMLCQIPVVVTRGWGWLDTVQDGVNGFLVERGNVEHLTDAIARCLSKPEKLRAMGQAGRNIILRNFTWDLVAKRMHDALASLIQRDITADAEATKLAKLPC
jgi:glycosyltransferase involved in cell wall biosynthesis